jgi:hypothetical protein
MLIKYKDDEGNIRSVSRPTVYQWISKGTTPSSMIHDSIYETLNAISNAVSKGELPLRLGTPRDQRKILIKDVVLAHIKA